MIRKILSALLLSALLLLSACGTAAPAQEKSGALTVAATTYPVYLFACQVTKGVEGVTVTPVINQKVSCLHNYTLSVNEMKTLEAANVIAISGAGFEDFMQDALNASGSSIIDCSKNIALLKTPDGEEDPHIWLDPARAAQMIQNLADGLSELDPANKDAYEANAAQAADSLAAAQKELSAKLQGLSCRELITFHDGFAYFCSAFDLTLLKSIEEEPGSEASAKDISEIESLIQAHHLPAIFTEVNGSTATADAIARETGVKVDTLSMLISGDTDHPGLDTYLQGLTTNVNTVLEALG